MTTEMWLGYAENAGRREVLMALKRIAPGSAVVFARSAQELRERFADEEPGTVGAIIGHAGDGVLGYVDHAPVGQNAQRVAACFIEVDEFHFYASFRFSHQWRDEFGQRAHDLVKGFFLPDGLACHGAAL